MSTEDSAFSILRTVDGMVASLRSSAIQWRHKFSIELIFTEGEVALNELITATNSYGEERLTYYQKDLCQRTRGLGKSIEHTMCFDKDYSWDYMINEFYDAVVKRKTGHRGNH